MVKLNQLYIPCLLWKTGEYQALSKLSEDSKNKILPIIEVAAIGFDFESRTEIKTIDKHLLDFAKRVRAKWGKRLCFIDTHNIDRSTQMSTGQHPANYIFDDLRSKGVLAIPVVGLTSSVHDFPIYKSIINKDKRGLCFRVSLEEVIRDDFEDRLSEVIRSYGIGRESCDLILDLKAPNFEPIHEFAQLLSEIISNLKELKSWRIFGLISTSFPETLGGIPLGATIFPRNEWNLYKRIFSILKNTEVRIPNFGDYAINHPNQLLLDMRIIKPSASIRYTINDNWLIIKGQNVRDYHFLQYVDLCKAVIESGHYLGYEFSQGDKYISDCSTNSDLTGNLTTWRWVGTNHHLEKVSLDFSNLVDS